MDFSNLPGEDFIVQGTIQQVCDDMGCSSLMYCYRNKLKVLRMVRSCPLCKGQIENL